MFISFTIIKLSLNIQNGVDCARVHFAIAADTSVNFFLYFDYHGDRSDAPKITECVSKSFIKLYVFHILSSFMLSFSL